MKGRTVLVVDDDDRYREGLLRSLRVEGAVADGARSGEEAMKMVEKYPQRYQFAVIDHFLGFGMDGIQVTKELVDRNQNLFALVFTNVPTDSREDIARFRYQALSAGAYRYLERSSAHEAPKQVMDFVGEIEQLLSLSSWIRIYYESREHVPSLLTQLDIGVYIVDRSHKVWFMNDAMRRITGLGGQDLPRKPCSMWHGYRFLPCRGCLVQETFQGCEFHYGVFLSPLVFRDREKLFYMNVWTQPILDQKGNILLGTDGRPLAVMESVQELTGTAQLRQMSLDERLEVIANALCERPVEGTYLGETYFQTVEIYIREANGEFVLKAAVGFDPSLKLGVPGDVYAGGYLQVAEEHMRRSGYGFFFPKVGVMERVVYWPVLEGDRTIAILRVGCCANYGEDSVPYIKSYADEVRNAISDAQDTSWNVSAQIESEIAEIDLRLQTVASPEEALQTLVSWACKLTGSYLPVLRYREGDNAVLLRLGLKEYGEYERVVEPSYPLSYMGSWSSRTIVSGQEYVVNMTSNREEIEARRRQLPEEAKKALADYMALCIEPLLLEGRCIGALSLHSRDPQNYSNQKKLQIVRAIARRTALALHDYMVDQKAQKRVERAQYETIGLVLHNINTPIGTIQYALDMLRDHIRKNHPSDEYALEELDDIVRQISKIAKLRLEFLDLQKYWESRLERVNIHELVRSKVDEFVGTSKDIFVEYNLDNSIGDVLIDAAAVSACLEVLVQNSLDELERVAQDREIGVSLRPVSAGDLAHLSSASPGLAIDVEDNGPGVPSDIVKELFNIIRSGKAKGLGFGLSYCRKVARSAHGDVYYHNEYKSGAKFTIVLPYVAV